MDLIEENITKKIHPMKCYRNFLNHGMRPDGRRLSNYRPVVVGLQCIQTADGSCVVKIGNTTVVCGIKAEIAPADSSEPDKGMIIPNIDMSPVCSTTFRAGPPSSEEQTLTQALLEIITETDCIDLKELCISKGSLVWILYCDVTCLSFDGSIFGAVLLALFASLKTLKLPKVTYNDISKVCKTNASEHRSLNIGNFPVASTFITIDDCVIADPNEEEENFADPVVVVTCNFKIIYVFQQGRTPINRNFYKSYLKIAIEHEQAVKKILTPILDK